MFKHRVNGASGDRVNRASSACVACPDGSLLVLTEMLDKIDHRLERSPTKSSLCVAQQVGCLSLQ